MRIRLTLDIERRRPSEPYVAESERPPMVDGKGAFILERAEQADHDDIQRIGFVRNAL